MCGRKRCIKDAPLHGFTNLVSNGISTQFTRSTGPLTLGTPVVINICSMFSFLQYSAKLFKMKAVPLSEITLRGFLKTNNCFVNLFRTSLIDSSHSVKLYEL